jgi:hypothetical protein
MVISAFQARTLVMMMLSRLRASEAGIHLLKTPDSQHQDQKLQTSQLNQLTHHNGINISIRSETPVYSSRRSTGPQNLPTMVLIIQKRHAILILT